MDILTIAMITDQRPISHHARVAQLEDQYRSEQRAAFSKHGRNDPTEAARLAHEALRKFLRDLGDTVDEHLGSIQDPKWK